MDPLHYHILGSPGMGMMKKIRHLPQTTKKNQKGVIYTRIGYRNVTISYANQQEMTLENLCDFLFEKGKWANEALLPTTTAVTPVASHPSRQP